MFWTDSAAPLCCCCGPEGTAAHCSLTQLCSCAPMWNTNLRIWTKRYKTSVTNQTWLWMYWAQYYTPLGDYLRLCTKPLKQFNLQFKIQPETGNWLLLAFTGISHGKCKHWTRWKPVMRFFCNLAKDTEHDRLLPTLWASKVSEGTIYHYSSI